MPLENEVDRGDELPEETVALTDEAKEAVVTGDDVTEVVEDLQTETEETETEEAPAPERDEKGKFIPKERFDAAVQRERTEKERLAARNAELEKREADRAVSQDLTQAQAKIKEMIKEHTQMLADGELDKASELMGDILELQSDIADYRSRTYADQGRTQAKSEIQYDSVVARLEADYPEINPENEETFDRDAVRRVQAYMTGLIQMEKMAPAKALQEAVTTILGAKRAEAEQTTDTKADTAAALGMRRKEAAVGKAVDAQKKQPAALKDVGQDHDKTGGQLDAAAVMKMSWEDFIKLPEDKLAQLRGDTVG